VDDDPERTVTSSVGPLAIRRPRVRRVAHESTLIPKFRRRLSSIDKTIHQLWIEGLGNDETFSVRTGDVILHAPDMRIK